MTTPFAPSYGSSLALSPGVASAASNIRAGTRQIRIVNTGSAIAYIRTFDSQNTPAPAATSADFAIPAGMASVISKDPMHDRIAHISPAGTTLQVMVGEGM